MDMASSSSTDDDRYCMTTPIATETTAMTTTTRARDVQQLRIYYSIDGDRSRLQDISLELARDLSEQLLSLVIQGYVPHSRDILTTLTFSSLRNFKLDTYNERDTIALDLRPFLSNASTPNLTSLSLCDVNNTHDALVSSITPKARLQSLVLNGCLMTEASLLTLLETLSKPVIDVQQQQRQELKKLTLILIPHVITSAVLNVIAQNMYALEELRLQLDHQILPTSKLERFLDTRMQITTNKLLKLCISQSFDFQGNGCHDHSTVDNLLKKIGQNAKHWVYAEQREQPRYYYNDIKMKKELSG
ncbi:hypothetical protein BDB00DRAFT_449474 [Zychaea mexicana]|uniref:uncharacterized protein n=1 Tax=Zychaea mexicana TaxID=64656 RepID=UPI0022FF1A28|nr:uncharacterized protein BDB00DRAFT_449474 [Zychaea mexicana]KAI9498448.1 hypothetical protein BDB00DRAFT_449474 [Zychaea mexicana]